MSRMKPPSLAVVQMPTRAEHANIPKVPRTACIVFVTVFGRYGLGLWIKNLRLALWLAANVPKNLSLSPRARSS